MPNYSVTATNNSDTAWQAFDKNLSTGWVNESSGGSITFDFNTPTIVKGFRFIPPIDATTFPTKIDIYARTSSTSIGFKSFTTSTPVAGVPQDYILKSPVKYDGFLFAIRTPHKGSGNVAIADIEFLVYRNSIAPEPTLQEKTVTPTKAKQSITADSSYDGLSKVDVNAIPDEYTDTSDATVSASDILSGKTAYGSSGKVTGTMATVLVPTPTIDVSSTGLITASNTQTAGYTAGGTKSATSQLTRKTAETFVPTTTNQTISSGQYLTGVQTIKGDSNLKAANIKSGVSIFGVSGSYSGIDTSDATATASDIVSGKTAYVNGSKVTGSGRFLRDTVSLTIINNSSTSGYFVNTGFYKEFPDLVNIAIPISDTVNDKVAPGSVPIFLDPTSNGIKIRLNSQTGSKLHSPYFQCPATLTSFIIKSDWQTIPPINRKIYGVLELYGNYTDTVSYEIEIIDA